MLDTNSAQDSPSWLTDELKTEVRKKFEPRYKRKLTDKEVIEVAENVEEVVETILRFLWRKKYENIRY
jgi:hypothetical protein